MTRRFYRYKRFWLLAILGLGLIWLLTLRPVQIILQTAPNKPRADTAMPVLPDLTAEQWQARRPDILKTLEHSLYGTFPNDLEISVISRTPLAAPETKAFAKIDVFKLEISATPNSDRTRFNFILLSPVKPPENPALILTQNFCPNHNVAPIDGIPVPENLGFSCEGDGFFASLMTYFFGRYIVSPPAEMILSQGYSLGVMHPSEFIIDSPQLGQTQLDQLFAPIPKPDRPGALMAWAALSVNIAELLSEEYPSIITWGHSRYGKTALLAAAYSDHINGAISHQSGTGGASLFRDKPGETLTDIVGGYPHWFGQNAQAYMADPHSLPLDQHFLLAALAPKPILLGNARRDVWSDPEGAFRAARAATPAYQAYTKPGLTAQTLNAFKPADDLSFWIRPGTHGVTEEDWPAFLEFLNAHFPVNE